MEREETCLPNKNSQVAICDLWLVERSGVRVSHFGCPTPTCPPPPSPEQVDKCEVQQEDPKGPTRVSFHSSSTNKLWTLCVSVSGVLAGPRAPLMVTNRHSTVAPAPVDSCARFMWTPPSHHDTAEALVYIVSQANVTITKISGYNEAA